MIRIQGGAKQTNPEFGRNESKKSPGWWAGGSHDTWSYHQVRRPGFAIS